MSVEDPQHGLAHNTGQVIGPSPWVTVTQAMIDQFGAATLDPDPMHVDPAWARANSPFGEPVAFGFLTVSLLTHLIHAAGSTTPAADPARLGSFVNYGVEKLRLVAPVPAGTRIRATFRCDGVRTDPRGRQIATYHAVVDVEGGDRPALVGDWLALWLPPGARA